MIIDEKIATGIIIALLFVIVISWGCCKYSENFVMYGRNLNEIETNIVSHSNAKASFDSGSAYVLEGQDHIANINYTEEQEAELSNKGEEVTNFEAPDGISVYGDGAHLKAIKSIVWNTGLVPFRSGFYSRARKEMDIKRGAIQNVEFTINKLQNYYKQN